MSTYSGTWLAIDVGNTNAVMGLFRGETLVRCTRVSTHPIGTSDELLIKIRMLFSDAFDSIEHVVVSSVVPVFSAVLKQVFEKSKLRYIDSTWPFAFRIEASPPSQVGADRLVNAEAALAAYGAPAIIVDSGTATTVCAVSSDGAYLGGAIMPGIELATKALAQNTAKLFVVELEPPTHAIGTNTHEAIQSGMVLGYASMLDGMVGRFRAEMGTPDAPVIATGGVSLRLKGVAQSFTHHDPDLTLKGMNLLWQKKWREEQGGVR